MPKAKSNLPFVISHWHHLFENMQHSPQALYDDIEAAIKTRNLPDVKLHRIELSEGGVFSAKRLYLRVSRKGLTFDICGAPYGNGFFISWWLSEPAMGCLAIIAGIPFLNILAAFLLPPDTYFKKDTAFMFQESVRLTIQEVLGGYVESRGLRALTVDEQKPVMRALT